MTAPSALRTAAPYLIAAALIAGAYVQGRSDGRAVMASKALEQVKLVQIAADKSRIRIDGAVALLASAQSGQATEFREINRETIRVIDRPVYRVTCVDADGVGLLDRARAAANRDLAGASAFTAPGVAARPAQR